MVHHSALMVHERGLIAPFGILNGALVVHGGYMRVKIGWIATLFFDFYRFLRAIVVWVVDWLTRWFVGHLAGCCKALNDGCGELYWSERRKLIRWGDGGHLRVPCSWRQEHGRVNMGKNEYF